MKTKNSFYKREFSVIFIMIFWVTGLGSANAQTAHLAKSLTAPYNVAPYISELIQYDFGQLHRFGIGIDVPQAKFHIQVPTLTTLPSFEVEIPNIGSIKHLFTDLSGLKSYGIYQQGSSLQNYFEGDVICNSELGFDGQNSGIWIQNQDEGFPFRFSLTVPDPMVTTPLTIKWNGVIVRNLMECNNFLLHNNAGSGRVLISDNIGNGMWTDASNFHDDDWLPAAHIGNLDIQDLYLNKGKYEFVGIGTVTPNQKLHVEDGNILISRSRTKTPGSKNGSILFGDVIDDKNTLGEWGIEYYTGNDDYASNGLNFWKPFSSGNGGGNDYLYLRNDGAVCIGTEKSCGDYKLAVKGKILCTELKVIDIGEFCDYVFDKSYKLMPLYDVERFINANHHLPDVPSADEVKSNGLNMGEMNTLLMKKVEELTLYIINQQKQIDELKAAIHSK